ncbi:GLEYA adhesin domain [Cordyceps javanica]|uniref:GLEYA adhesin domain n=1 Tax=Cordyceps javanica TaxID=43265 RepID=A0A545VPW0_9HYPO|nr:GLEYA adhesin domain [Cordyceps javanica]TQW03752.1 GLEYA adhesin domain [Cordyceps javanica]
MQILPLFLALASVAAANQQQDVVTITNYLPFDQHPCYEFFMLGADGDLPTEACQPGACCIDVVDVNTKTDHGSNNVGIDEHLTTTSLVSQSSNGGSSDGVDCGSVTTTVSPGGSTSPPITSGSKITKISSDGSITRTFVETITKNRTITEELTVTSFETVPETSHETEVITTTIPDVVTFTTTSSGTPIVETSTSEVLTTKIITSDVVISTTETLTTPVIVTSTEVITTSNSTITSLITTTSEETVTSVEPILTSATEVLTTSSIVVTPTVITKSSTVAEPVTSLIPPPPEPSDEREIPSSCPTPTCSHGIQYALYDNPFRDDLSPTYESFSPDYFKKARPVYSTTLQSAIYISDDADDDAGRGFNPLFENAAAGYRGFLFACEAGRYRFNSPYSDDITVMWFGAAAYEGYARDNADIVQFYYGDNSPRDVYRDLAAGTYYPIRVLWGNTGGASDLSLRIYGPDGRDVSGADHAGEHYLTTEACDGSYAPFPAWGEEK